MSKICKKAFTMIELIFVIIVIGILASIALSKLTATRDDALITKMISNTRIVLGDLSAYYTANGNARWVNAKLSDATHVLLKTSNCADQDLATTDISEGNFTLCNELVSCLYFETEDEGNLTIAPVTANASDSVCRGVQNDETIRAMLKEHQLGGKSVER